MIYVRLYKKRSGTYVPSQNLPCENHNVFPTKGGFKMKDEKSEEFRKGY